MWRSLDDESLLATKFKIVYVAGSIRKKPRLICASKGKRDENTDMCKTHITSWCDSKQHSLFSPWSCDWALVRGLLGVVTKVSTLSDGTGMVVKAELRCKSLPSWELHWACAAVLWGFSAATPSTATSSLSSALTTLSLDVPWLSSIPIQLRDTDWETRLSPACVHGPGCTSSWCKDSIMLTSDPEGTELRLTGL